MKSNMTKEELLIKELREEKRKYEALNALFELKKAKEELTKQVLSEIADAENALEEKYEETIETLLKVAFDDWFNLWDFYSPLGFSLKLHALNEELN